MNVSSDRYRADRANTQTDTISPILDYELVYFPLVCKFIQSVVVNSNPNITFNRSESAGISVQIYTNSKENFRLLSGNRSTKTDFLILYKALFNVNKCMLKSVWINMLLCCPCKPHDRFTPNVQMNCNLFGKFRSNPFNCYNIVN